MNKLDYSLLDQVKRGFVQQPGSDPSMGGAPADPSMGGMPPGAPGAGAGAPMDPAMMGGAPGAAPMPPAGLDPAMAGMLGGGAAPGAPTGGPSQFTITMDDLVKLIKLYRGGPADAVLSAPGQAQPAAQPQSPTPSATDSKLDKLTALLESALGGGEQM